MIDSIYSRKMEELNYGDYYSNYTSAALRGGKVPKGSAAAKAKMAYLRSLRGKGVSSRKTVRRSTAAKMKGGFNPLMLVGPALTAGKLVYKLIKKLKEKRAAQKAAAGASGGAMMSKVNRDKLLAAIAAKYR